MQINIKKVQKMKKLAKSIAKYAEYLRSVKLGVSVHFSNEMLGILPTDIFDVLCCFNVHTNPYCMWVKKCDNHKCIESQQELIKNGSKGVRVCHAGVKEYITPFFRKGVPVGIVSLSGYRESAEGVQNTALWEESLSDGEIPFELAETLITPLAVMLERLVGGDFAEECSEYNLILQYLAEYYATADLDGICRHFHRSPSHVSHTFKKNSGMTLRAYCNKLRLEKAERMLLSTDFSVTRIAFETGFGDVSHFINLFRKKYGASPLAYRKSIDKKRDIE